MTHQTPYVLVIICSREWEPYATQLVLQIAANWLYNNNNVSTPNCEESESKRDEREYLIDDWKPCFYQFNWLCLRRHDTKNGNRQLTSICLKRKWDSCTIAWVCQLKTYCRSNDSIRSSLSLSTHKQIHSYIWFMSELVGFSYHYPPNASIRT